MHICWGAQAGLYARYGVPKHSMSRKLSGVYCQEVTNPTSPLMRGFDDEFRSPHSRYTEVREADIAHLSELTILSQGPEVGLSILASKDLREVYSFGHLEYDRDTLAKEYQRDCIAGKIPIYRKIISKKITLQANHLSLGFTSSTILYQLGELCCLSRNSIRLAYL